MKRFLALALTLGLPLHALGAEEVRVQVLSATVKDQALSGAQVILQKNGEASAQTTTTAEGSARLSGFSGADDGSVNLIIKKDGYSNLVARCPCNGLTYALSPVMTQNLDGMRIVLNWGATPADLDSHLVHPSTHVFFSNQGGDLARLDVDDTTGFGPETITLDKKKPGVKYLYAVHNYSEAAATGSKSLADISKAKVFVYVGSSLVRTFTPPPGRAGNTWVVFAIGENGEFSDLNQFTDTGGGKNLGPQLQRMLQTGDLTSAPAVTGAQASSADDLNRRGEAAYHAKKLDEAVSLYLEAIANNPEHGQAYSNLGLAYQKLHRDAEALWANRKAIALASGPNADTVRASSHYNIARVYEADGKWAEALDSYQTAQSFKDHPAYRKGVEKMKQKLGQP
ncbi:tetratricopeptide repeat protein [Archangium primigenium]|uniref:tetratricopeptide repeat protein n=1 Tax=[Archangium] primigenium TaxID=2792470 RepID=UPI001958379A|nr:tetratricopeptide repeat protein [Archangium primigenium]MBM7116224.1 tetratricopeptide repeat protein [Archangium primigenium]